ncbi:enoyl-CoA hydratase [Bacillus sp. DTU_2020_1000418_1_SI_GHA_SEK_038]|uniref:enoyl-CoA hydratase/isomerase family protein n=1 Tax=Bacillus sp. DTU_2020_1000418_1_SI_GHA_SEK_038 TaxID=3077585 RepID=UPI0028E82BB6|nr:enoyl-CoA hydratase [Bacillus sp. DTU_2020_1000418_1_SI_GHA_SEK_038]WNS76173.1 enoyl-CoA hydratase [Bacillus sp. DTU_2020_1000418_1_SI_GHA_SEK_038]
MSLVKTALNDGVYEIELNRPKQLNALNSELLSDLTEAVREAKINSDIRAVLLYGSGKGFCSGGDLKDFGIDSTNPIEVKEFLQKGHEAIIGLYNMEKPVVASVHGPAVGAGCNLAFACDLIVADESAIFSEIFAKVGAIPDMGGLYFLPQKIGMHKAAELIFTGKKIDAHTASEYGLINEVVPEGQVIERGRELALSLANGPTKAIGIAKRIMHQSTHLSLEDILELEAYGQSVIFQTKDFSEGRKAFQEKREPIFLGF